jgi:general secretion pathway protein I
MRCGKWKSTQLRISLKNCRGFTLLEVIISLGIVAVGILAVSRAITGFAGTTLTLEQRMVASWVASNRLETHRILKTTPVVGTTHGSEEMAGHVWYFSETTTSTADPNLFRLDIVVFTDRDETEEAGNMYGYLLNYEAVNQPVITGSYQRNRSFKASLGKKLEKVSPLTERNWNPAFVRITKTQLSTQTKFIVIRHCEELTRKQSHCYWEIKTGLPHYAAREQKKKVALLQEIPVGSSSELYKVIYEI